MKPDRTVTRDRMHELEMSNQSHVIMLLKTEVNNKDMEIVEFKAQLQEYRMKCEKLLKEKDKVIQERNQANSRHVSPCYSRFSCTYVCMFLFLVFAVDMRCCWLCG